MRTITDSTEETAAHHTGMHARSETAPARTDPRVDSLQRQASLLAEIADQLRAEIGLLVEAEQEPEDRPAVLTAEEAARHLKVGRTTIYRLLREGRFPASGSAAPRGSPARSSTSTWPDQPGSRGVTNRRSPRGRPAIHKSTTQSGWEAWVSLPPGPLTRRRRRRHVRGATKTEVVKNLQQIEAERNSGREAFGPAAFDYFEWAVRLHLTGLFGSIRLRRLQPEHIELASRGGAGRAGSGACRAGRPESGWC